MRHKSITGNSCSVGSAEMSLVEAFVHSVSTGVNEESGFAVDFPEGRIWSLRNGKVVDSIMSFIPAFVLTESSEESMKCESLAATASRESIVLNIIGFVDTASK